MSISYLRKLLLAAVLLPALALPAAAEISGDFEAIGPLPGPKSLEVVEFDEYLNFSCPHCNNFRKAAKPLKEKFGKKLKVRYIPILFKNQGDSPMRLFFIGEAEGRTEEIKEIIFDAKFKFLVDVYDPAVVNYLAKSAGLGEKYKKEGHSDWVNRKVMEAKEMTKRAGIRATPTVVLQKSIRVKPTRGMNTFVANLDSIISQLLK